MSARSALRQGRDRGAASLPGGGLAGPLLVLALAAVGVAAVGTGAGGGPADVARRVPVVHDLQVCPAGGPVSGTGSVSVVLAPDVAPSSPGVLRTRVLGGDGDVDVSAATQRGRAVSGEVPGRLTAVEVRADDGAGAGVFGAGVARRDGAVATAGCVRPRASWWFVGAGAALDHRSTLVLDNVDQGVAVVDITVHGTDGPVETAGTRGISIAPQDRLVLRLPALAPGNAEVAVGVSASRGRVVASLADETQTSPAAPPALEWLPPAVAPTRRLVLAGLPARAEERTLLVLNRAEREAVVEVSVAGATGSFPPAGLERLRIPPGALASATVPELPGGEAAAVVLRSEVPVTATVRSRVGDDVGYAVTARALGGPAAAVVPPGLRGRLLLTAGEDGATVRVEARAADGSPTGGRDLALVPGASLAWAVPRDTAYVLVQPTRGRVRGAVSLLGDPGVSQLPLEPLRTQTVEPPVRGVDTLW